MRWPLPLALLLASGCAYYNGIYNAKGATKSADRQFNRGESFVAGQAYLEAAAKAETVLARHPNTRWRRDALYIAGRGHALGGECERGMRRLDEFLRTYPQPSRERDRAQIARASCLLENNQILAADTLLRPLLTSRDEAIRAEASLYAGRAALQVGDAERGGELLARAPGSAAAWYFVTAALQARDIARAESLLVARAQAGDWRSEVYRHVRVLWGAGARDGAVRVVDLYGSSRASTADRVSLRFLASDLAAAAGDTALARRQAIEAQRLGLSASVDAEARARLLALRIRELDALADVSAVLARDSARARGSPILKRITDNLTLVRLLQNNPDNAGAHQFLAAELVRDSLGANALAHAMFRSIAREYPHREIAARALYASRLIVPESTSVYNARIVAEWPRSYAAISLQDLSPDSSTVRAENAALSRAWSVMLNKWADTLKARRVADSLAALNAGRRD